MSLLKRYTIWGLIFALIVGTIAHFVYGWTNNNFAAGFFFPVNESVWEHMKLAFFPVLLYSFYMNRRLKKTYPCITSSLCFGIILGTLSMPVIFYTYSGVLGYHTLALDIVNFIVSVILAFGAIYKLTLSCSMQKYLLVLKICVSLLALMFFLFTYLPPGLGIFADPTL